MFTKSPLPTRKYGAEVPHLVGRARGTQPKRSTLGRFHRMATQSWRGKFWRRWIAANAIAELVGLGTVATLGYVVAACLGEPHSPLSAITLAAAFVVLGAFEGLAVGVAQFWVLRAGLPNIHGWVSATVIGAVVAWAVGMAPSTVMSIFGPDSSGAPPEISEPVRLAMASALGLAAGPILAFFQWRRLRRHVAGAAWWLPANAVAWALGMPVIFAGAHLGALTANPALIVPGVALVLLAAGAVVGALHGAALVWLISEGASRAPAA